MNESIIKWLRICFFNLLVVALLGVILRYKIAFSLPLVNQQYLLHGHSHFAFAGWVTQILMVMMVAYLSGQGFQDAFRKYRFLLYANLLTAYGMLVTFPFQGYGLFSILFSFFSILVSYAFAVRYWRDLNKLPVSSAVHHWFKAAIGFNAFSSVGVFGLAFIMATKTQHPNLYLASIYFYLHFQYNGWFFFACMGLAAAQLIRYGIAPVKLINVFWLFMAACIPAYLLSTLWLHLPVSVYYLVIVAVVLQVIAWTSLLKSVIPLLSTLRTTISLAAQRLIMLAVIAGSIKILLQAGSVVPSLSKLAFGFRPIVIGYLHLVLLGMITLFIAGYALAAKYLPVTVLVVRGSVVFVLGIILNELFLMAQGVAGFDYTTIPFINQLLLFAALLLFTGALLMNAGIRKRRNGFD